MSTEVAKTLLIMRHSRIIQEMAMVNNQASIETKCCDGWSCDWRRPLSELAAEAKEIEDRLEELAKHEGSAQ